MLPQAKTPIYELTLPSNGKKYKYRPWDGKEEKSIQIALMDEDKQTIRNTLYSVMDACLYNELDINNLPDVDVDWILAQLRTKSVGEIVELTASCTSCEKDYDLYVNLMEAVVEDGNKDSRGKPIKVDDDIYFVMDLPSKENIEKHNKNPLDFTIDHLIASMIKTISTSEQSYSPKDYTFAELVDYVESFNKQKMRQVYDYVADLPRVVTTTTAVCKHCKTTHNIRLEGTEFFFV